MQYFYMMDSDSDSESAAVRSSQVTSIITVTVILNVWQQVQL